MDQVQLERLVEKGIELLPAPEITTHFLFTRDGFVSLVERRGVDFGGIGAPGLLIEQGGFAALVWRGDHPVFVARGFEQPASAGEVEQIRRFATDLDYAIRGPNRV